MLNLSQRGTPMPETVSDVLIIGGGPAGTTAATLLQQSGWRVVLLEKEHHPRFHVGESLLPMNLPILERLGVLEQVRGIGVTKYGAEFGSAVETRYQTIRFSDALDKNHPYAFQVRRAEFDDLLFRNSVAKGVTAREGVRVTEVIFRPGRNTIVRSVDDNDRQQVWETRYVIDASGRDTFLAHKFKCKQKNSHHQSAALFGHFANVTRRFGKDEGNISIYWFQHGWFWMIPLQDGIMSVGCVCWPEYLKTRRTSPDAFLWQTIALCPPVQERMCQAQLLGAAGATGNYSYRAGHMVGDGYLLVGDAYAYVDPVFSTGVYFAMNGAVLAAEAVNAYLREPTQAKSLLAQFDRQVRHGINVVSWFIYRFTSPAMQSLFMAPRNVWRLEEALISMLAGDVFRNTPIAARLALFKLIYRVTGLLQSSRAWTAYRLRKRNVKLLFEGGTTPQDQC
jgi:flavin-dependent dehydrogenase